MMRNVFFLSLMAASLSSAVLGFAPSAVSSPRIRDVQQLQFQSSSDRYTYTADDEDEDDPSVHASDTSTETSKAHAYACADTPRRRSVLSSLAILVLYTSLTIHTLPATAASIMDDQAVDGIPAITRSTLGTSVRRATVRSAQLADKLDEKWERYSDSLRDENKCDPVTGRKMFDNGFRKDGTRIGNPVLGGLCKPEPLLPVDDHVAQLVLGSAEEEVALMLGAGGGNKNVLQRKVSDVDALVGPSFARAKTATSTTDGTTNEEDDKRNLYNRNAYSRMRAYGELLLSNQNPKSDRAKAADFELRWGRRLLFGDDSSSDNSLIPSRLANRKYFKSPFPPLSDDDRGDLAYEEGALLDGLGTLSSALEALQAGGIIGHWEISVPTDDYGEVVTIAIDDDISLGAQALLREGRNGIVLNGSVVTAITRAALNRFGVSVAVDAFFLDPSTTKQDVFNPSQLVLNLSGIKGS
jgi:hypothetical protein